MSYDPRVEEEGEMMGEPIQDNVSWSDLESTSSDTILEKAIVDVEEKFQETYGWNSPPITLGVLYMSTLGGMGSVSVQFFSDLPEAVIEEPMPGFMFMVDLMVKDVAAKDPDMEWLDEIVCRTGFIGWIVIVAGFADEEETKQVRNLLYYSRSQGIFVSLREEGAEPQQTWVPEQSICEESELARTMVKLNDISHYVRLRNWVEGES